MCVCVCVHVCRCMCVSVRSGWVGISGCECGVVSTRVFNPGGHI